MATVLDFDPALPGLHAIDDSPEVVRILAPGADDVRVRRQDTKYDPGVRCVAAQQVNHRGPSSTPAGPVLGAVVVTTGGVDGYLMERDPGLPSIGEALDAPAMAARLTDALPPGRRESTWTAAPVRYKPGRQCVTRYDVTSQGEKDVFYGKLFAGGCSTLVRLIGELTTVAADVEHAPVVLPVVGHWPDLGLMVQPAVRPMVDVHALAGDPSAPSEQRRSALTGAGRALAALHCCPLPEAPTRTRADDLRELRDYRPAVARADGALGVHYSQVLERLGSSSGEEEAAVTSHGAFRTDQLVLSGDRFVMIDLDTVCRGEPARDIGNLLAYLDWKAIRLPGLAEDFAELGRAFLEGYDGRRRLPAPSLIAWHRAASLVKIAGRRYRSLSTKEWPLVPTLLIGAERYAADLPVGAS